MSILALLTGSGATSNPPAPQVRTMHLMTLTETVKAAPSPYTIAEGAAPTGGTIAPANTARLIGTDQPGDVGWRTEAHSWEFTYTGAKIGFTINPGTAGSTEKAFQVFVDGHPTSADYIYPTASTVYVVDFGTAATRTIRVDLSQVKLEAIHYTAGAILTPTAQRQKLYFMGDSWVQGASYTANGNGPEIEHMAFLTGRLLDASTIIAGIGGSGYLNGNTRSPATHYTADDRLMRIKAQQPDVLVVFGSINDPQATDGTLKASADKLFDYVATNSPGTKIVVIGVQDYGQGFTGTDSRPELTQAVQGHSNVIAYRQPLVEDWVADGDSTINNVAYNNAHLTKHGNEVYAEKVAGAVAEALGLGVSSA